MKWTGASVTTAQVELGGEIERLADFAAREGLTARMVVELAVAVAENLAHLHGQRRAHGAVAERNILVCDGQGWLTPPERSQAGATVADDVRQFGDLFRSLLAEVGDPVAAQASREIDALLEKVQGKSVDSSRQMKRIAPGLKVLRARVSNVGPVLIERAGRRVAPEVEEARPACGAGRSGLFAFHWYVALTWAALATTLAALFLRTLR